MVNDRTHSSEIHDRTGDPWPAGPTPKLTAEMTEKELAERNKIVHDRAVRDYYRGRSKAFEQAAEGLDFEADRFGRKKWEPANRRQHEYRRAASLVRALAKEKADG